MIVGIGPSRQAVFPGRMGRALVTAACPRTPLQGSWYSVLVEDLAPSKQAFTTMRELARV